MSSNTPQVSIISETYNLTEGTALATLRRSLARAIAEAERTGHGEVLLADVYARPEVDRLLSDFPSVRKIPCEGLSYDAAKNRSVEAAEGEYVAFLDGDCIPDEGWLDALLAPLRSGLAQTTCGFTTYAGGFWAAVQTVMDFGFLLPARSRSVGCYPCNNWATKRSALLAHPIPLHEDLRCTCYLHAQQLERQGQPVLMVPEARVHHDLPPFWQERLRRGFDHVAACWADPGLGQSRWLDRGLKAVPAFYRDNVKLDRKLLRSSGSELGLSNGQATLALGLVPLLRTVDVIGVVRALRQQQRRATAPGRHAREAKPE